MQEPSPPLDHWLVSYILHKRRNQSRFEIDQYLINLHYNPAQIETAWQAVLDNTYQQKLPGYTRLRKPSKVAGCLKYGCLVSLGMLVLLVISLIILLAIVRNVSLPEPLPAYPNAISLEAKKELPEAFLFSYDCVGYNYSFIGKKVQAFATSDEIGTVIAYYKSIVEKQKLGAFSNYGGFSNFCVVKDESHLFTTQRPANNIEFLLPDNPKNAKVIAEYFPQTPTHMNVILLIQGYVERTLG